MPGDMPDYLVIGAMKCATSTLCAYLEDHPEVYCVPRCEPNYFNHDENFAKGAEWYRSLFKPEGTEKLSGEGSNYYSARALFPQTAERIAAFNPDMKIIYMVRDPMVRIVSAWIQRRADSRDAVPPSVDGAVTQMPDDFVGQSLYSYNIAPYRDHFPAENIFIGFLEDMNRTPDAFYPQICRFLGIAEKMPERGHMNTSSGKKVLGETYTKVNNIPFVKSAKKLAPNGLKRSLRRLLEKDVADLKPALSPDVKAQVLRSVRPDAEAILDFAGKPRDFWSLGADERSS